MLLFFFIVHLPLLPIVIGRCAQVPPLKRTIWLALSVTLVPNSGSNAVAVTSSWALPGLNGGPPAGLRVVSQAVGVGEHVALKPNQPTETADRLAR